MVVPTVGRIVHYVGRGVVGSEPGGSACLAALVTVTYQTFDDRPAGTVGLAVFAPTGLQFWPHVPYLETPSPGTWHWPEKV